MKILKLLLLCSTLVLTTPVQALNVPRDPKHLVPIEQWVAVQSEISIRKIRENIAPVGTVPGVVIASPQKQNPNYFRHWVRDAGLVMDVVFQTYQRTDDPVQKEKWAKLLHDYTIFSRQNQMANAKTGLGEPIFEVNGEPFQGPWGRPQNDGPALRAIALIQWAHSLLDQGQKDYVRRWLYSNQLPALTVIKTDLEFVSHNWRAANFDLWEEVKGQHFFTRMVQRKALVLGAELAQRMQDPLAAKWYLSQAQALEHEIETHWDASRGLIRATTNFAEGANYKHSGLDIAVILGVLHGSTGDFFTASDDRVVKTMEKLVRVFADLYPVNHNSDVPGIAIGRYPEDLYAGTNFDGGNPWVLTTLAAAQHCYLLAQQIADSNRELAKEFIKHGDRFFQRVQYHANPDGSLSEQIQRYTGYMVSASDLTWSYAAVLTAAWAREQSVAQMNKAYKNKQTKLSPETTGGK